MKKRNLIIAIFLYINALAIVPVLSFAPPLPPSPRQLVSTNKGAASVTELSRIVLQAIQKNNFEDLNGILLDEETLSLFKQKGTEDIRGLLENTSAADIKNNLKTQYQEIIQQGIGRTINWSEVSLLDTKLGKGTAKNPMVQPLTLNLAHRAKQPLQIILETAKLNNRYYVFGRMALKP